MAAAGKRRCRPASAGIYGGGVGRRLVYGGGIGRSGRGFACKRPWLVNGGGVGRQLWKRAVASGARVAALLENNRGSLTAAASGVGWYIWAAAGARVVASLVNGHATGKRRWRRASAGIRRWSRALLYKRLWLANAGGVGRRLVCGGGVGCSGRGFACRRPRLVNGGGFGHRKAAASGARVAALLAKGRGW
jgi:hypothetical protein